MGRSQKVLSQQTQSVEEITETMVQEAVKIILVLDATKRPMKQSDIMTHLFVKPKRKMIGEFWDCVKQSLDALGINLVEINVPSGKAFILIAQDQELPFMYKYLSRDERAERTLLVLALAYIFMKDDMVAEDELLRHFMSLKIIGTSPIHPYFGDVKKKLTGQFVEQAYLLKGVGQGQGVPEYRWGPRALLEVPQMAILEFVCKIGYGERMQPKHWVSHYEKINNESNDEVDETIE